LFYLHKIEHLVFVFLHLKALFRDELNFASKLYLSLAQISQRFFLDLDQILYFQHKLDTSYSVLDEDVVDH